MTTQRIAELEAEVMRLREALDCLRRATGKVTDVREPMDWPEINYAQMLALQALLTPFTPTALNDLVEKVEKMTINRCADRLMNFYDSCCTRNIEDFSKAIRTLPVGQIKLEELLA